MSSGPAAILLTAAIVLIALVLYAVVAGPSPDPATCAHSLVPGC